MDEGVPERITEELFEIFCYMRNTFEGIVACNNPNVWNVFGGLNRAKKATFNVLTHELRSSNIQPYEVDLVQKLCKKLLELYPCGDLGNDTDESFEEILSGWIEQRLLDHSLFDCINCAFLQKPEETLLQLYKEFSFIKNEILVKALLCCLDALQQNAIERLSHVNPILMNKSMFMAKITPWVVEKMMEEYRIDSTPPEVKQTVWPSTLQAPSSVSSYCDQCGGDASNLDFCLDCAKLNMERRLSSKSFSREVHENAFPCVPETSNENLTWYDEDDGFDKSDKIDDLRNRLQRMKEISRSESSLFHEPCQTDTKEVHSDLDHADEHEDTLSIDEANSETVSVDNMALPRSSSIVLKKKGHHRSKSDQIGVHTPVTNMEDENDDSSIQIASSLPKEVTQQGSCSYYYHSEDGQMFPKPYKGQSLISYLDSRSYDTGAQLDKENAHFSICEALITAIEQMRCQNKNNDEENYEQSDEEVLRSSQKLIRQRNDVSAFSDPSDEKSSSVKTSSTLSSSYGSSSTDDTDNEEAKKLTISASWENVSLASSKTLSPEVEKKPIAEKIDVIEASEVPPDDFSAETVAKSLLQKFDLSSIPAASELKWMVTEEVPQTLLPLPLELLHPDLHDGGKYRVQEGLRKISMPSLIRGNMEWAPPRPQIIFSPHPFVKRKVMLQKQHFRCAGCGLKVTPSLSKRFRFCEYVGKYFCTSCHQNKQALIPSKILTRWDFKKYPVSDFAKELLKKIHSDPLFNVLDVSPSLYDNVRQLNVVKCLRLQLHHIKNFLRSCRHADGSREDLMVLPDHLADDPHAFSLDDLVQVKSGEMQAALKVIVQNGITHIKACPLCSAKGFVCEVCRDGEDILYPFDLQKVYICQDCKTCYHRACFVHDKCARCARIKARKEMLLQEIHSDLADTTDS